jgi:hypothetical protein
MFSIITENLSFGYKNFPDNLLGKQWIKLQPVWKLRLKGEMKLTKRNRKTKSGLQSAKSLTSEEFSKELTASGKNQKAEKTKPNT